MNYQPKGFNEIKDNKEYHERINSLAPLLLNTNNKQLSKLSDEIFADYEVTMKFTLGHAPLSDYIIVSGMTLCERRDKFEPVVFGKGVELIEGTPTKTGGSNKYPRVCFEEDYCILKFKCHGLPIVDNSGWKAEIIELTKI